MLATSPVDRTKIEWLIYTCLPQPWTSCVELRGWIDSVPESSVDGARSQLLYVRGGETAYFIFVGNDIIASRTLLGAC